MGGKTEVFYNKFEVWAVKTAGVVGASSVIREMKKRSLWCEDADEPKE